MIVLPIVGGAVAGLIGLLILPYTKLITLGLGDVINGLTNTQPIIMTILIAMIFSINCFTDIINWDRFGNWHFRLSGGSVAVGVATSAIMLAVGRRVNKPGVPITVLLGAVKLMMPTIRHPMMMLPIVCTAGVSGFVGGLFNIKGTPDSEVSDSLVLLDRLNR